jgi:hypothetical protein
MERRSKSFCLFAVSAILILVLCATAIAEVPAEIEPNAGSVEGSVYKSNYFGFTYSFPEQWSVRSMAGRMPGNSAYMLLSLKPKTATGGLSTLMISAAKLPAEKDSALWQYMLERYRLNQAPESETTINGIPTSRMKRSATVPDPSILTFGERTFYRLRVDSPALSRIAIATMDKGFALVFEAIVPGTIADRTEMDLVSSMHTVNFSAAAPVRSETRNSATPR